MIRSLFRALPTPIRSMGFAVLHRWQRFYDVSRTNWRLFTFRGKWLDIRDSRRASKKAEMILQDNYGVRFVLYPWDRPQLAALVRRSDDAAEFQAISRLVRPGDITFDIGANLGVYSVLLSRLCGPGGSVWSFEPVPDTYWRLRETLALNRCDNVVALQRAVCDKVGTVRMNLFAAEFAQWNTLGTPTMSTANGTAVSPSQSVEVPANTLDQFCDAERIERIHFLKVDVEGFELSVFRGAGRLLRERRVDYVCFEISKEPLKGAGVQSRQVFEALEAQGYLAYRFDEQTRSFQGPVHDTSEYFANFYASWRDLSKMFGAKESDSSQEERAAGVLR